MESNCYFLECLIWLGIHLYRCLKLVLKREGSDRRLRESQFKAVKYLLDVLSSYNNSSLAKCYGKLNAKLVGIYTFVSSCIGMYLLWR